MGRRITILDVAKSTGLAVSTVSKAFKRSTDISEVTRAAVLKCAAEIGYIPKSSNKNKKIAVLVDGNDHLDKKSTDYPIYYGFNVTAVEYGYETETINLNEIIWDKAELRNSFFKNYAGVFLTRMNLNGIEEYIKRINAPIVSFGQIIEADNITYVGCDYQAGLNFAVKHLKELGHKKISFFGGDPNSLLNQYKKSEFITALRVQGLQVYPEIFFDSSYKVDFAAQYVSKILSESATAVVCSTDLLAYYMVNALREMHVLVPNRMSVIGFGDIPLCEETNPKLTTVSSNNLDLGRCIFHALCTHFDNLCVTKVLCRPSLIVRQSTAKPL